MTEATDNRNINGYVLPPPGADTWMFAVICEAIAGYTKAEPEEGLVNAVLKDVQALRRREARDPGCIIGPQKEDTSLDTERLNYIEKNARYDPKIDGNHTWWPTTFSKALRGRTLRAAIDAAMLPPTKS